MSPTTNTRITLAERPGFGNPIDPERTFRTETVPYPESISPEEILVKVQWLSLDPAMRVSLPRPQAH